MTIRYNEDLDPNEGPGFGCFIWQAILFAVILLLIPVGLFTFSWPVCCWRPCCSSTCSCSSS
jgi:hypothetical protein